MGRGRWLHPVESIGIGAPNVNLTKEIVGLSGWQGDVLNTLRK